MADEKKPGRWVKSLDKAGLIDDLKDTWRLPQDVSVTKTGTVVVGEDPTGPLDEADDGEARTAPERLARIKEYFAVGDYSGCLDLSEQHVKDHPGDEPVLAMIEQCRRVLLQMYESRIGSFDRVPQKKLSEQEIVWRNLDSLSGFIVASVDGMLSFEDIIDISTVSKFDTCRILSQLLQDGIIE